MPEITEEPPVGTVLFATGMEYTATVFVRHRDGYWEMTGGEGQFTWAHVSEFPGLVELVPAPWADPHAAAVDEMGADLYLTPRGEIGRYLIGCGDSPLERAFARFIGPVPEGWRRLYVEATAADDSSGKKD